MGRSDSCSLAPLRPTHPKSDRLPGQHPRGWLSNLLSDVAKDIAFRNIEQKVSICIKQIV
jgi:hypothetical protein